MGEINLMVWIQGAMVAAGIMGIAEIMVAIRWAQATAKLADGTANATSLDATATAADALKSAIELDMMWAGVEEAAMFMFIAEYGMDWLKGQLMLLVNAGVYTEEEIMEKWMESEGKGEWSDSDKEGHHDDMEGMDESEETPAEEESAEEEESAAEDDFAGFFGLHKKLAAKALKH